ncbi:hypothetical protein ACROYT_G014357 [Oculina patagonica]
MKEIRLSSRPKAKVSRLRHPGTLRAQPCILPVHLILGAIDYTKNKTETAPCGGALGEPTGEKTKLGWTVMSPGKEVDLSPMFFTQTSHVDWGHLSCTNGTHGDHLTLQAAADIFNIQIVVHSTLGATATQTISPTNGCPIATFYLGHFAEGAGEYYVCLADKTISDRSDTEYNCLSPVQDEQSDLGSRSGLNAPGKQSQSDADQYAPDIITTHGNRTRLDENEEQDTNNQCGYEQQGNDRASQFNECNADYGADINPDVLEDITETTAWGSSPEMRSSEPP